MKLTDFFKRKKAISAIEITVVVIMLFTMIIVIVDMSLYFRQPYLLQNFNDELLTKIQLAHQCYETDVNIPVIRDAVKKHYNKDINEISGRRQGADGEPEDEFADGIDYPIKKVYEYDADHFKILVTCKNPQMPDAVLTEYIYNGIFLYKNKRLTSNPSTNTVESYY